MPPPSAPSPAAGTETTPFPQVDSIRIRIPLGSDDWTIFPDPPETRRAWAIGFPLELHPFAWDYLRFSSKPKQVEIQPHYEWSSFDTFWIATSGQVTCHALGGAFPFTLGRQPELLDGLRRTIVALPPLIESHHPETAKRISAVADILSGLHLQLQQIPRDQLVREAAVLQEQQRASLRGRLSHALWKQKLPKPAHAAARARAATVR